ncbi:hypothetical protein BCR41DRAFT_388334 [Lobosporangium transversale]|uniref:Uncharacterized protein n=1 Tax=Lobosporangium transversale TaxID=64571 RepID=A0A1Y2GGT9_9FUNG|nr:hypothetical protein BCR41DRAFT_388334 [Lobosporangium transversale]ORZ09377.1 hypothetical protein BCR41DRAFT_388334 [Lobosporangium transversale]|eukprot:XP_021878830.1 hypothetical protein BCR41DRAFT_388334 [Lobosporangium transversale]
MTYPVPDTSVIDLGRKLSAALWRTYRPSSGFMVITNILSWNPNTWMHITIGLRTPFDIWEFISSFAILVSFQKSWILIHSRRSFSGGLTSPKIPTTSELKTLERARHACFFRLLGFADRFRFSLCTSLTRIVLVSVVVVVSEVLLEIVPEMLLKASISLEYGEPELEGLDWILAPPSSSPFSPF